MINNNLKIFVSFKCFSSSLYARRQNISLLASSGKVLENGVKYLNGFIKMSVHGPTADEITKDIDLTNKTCLITGANSGIGLEMTRCLNARNCNVLMACRNTYAANVAAKNVCVNNELVHVYETNLASLNIVKKFTDNILKDHKQLDIVILNAGVFGLPWTLTVDGLETTFQVNYLSQFYLLMNIEKILAPDARVVIISSESHRNLKWSLQKVLSPTIDQLSLPPHEYTSIKAYNVSKLCGVLAMRYLGYRWLNTDKSVFCAHPGSFVRTRLSRNWWIYEALYTAMLPFSKTIGQAACTPIYCATSPEVKGLSALYYKDRRSIQESELGFDSQLAFRIHDLTCDMIRERVADADEQAEPIEEAPHYEPTTLKSKHEVHSDTLISNY